MASVEATVRQHIRETWTMHRSRLDVLYMILGLNESHWIWVHGEAQPTFRVYEDLMRNVNPLPPAGGEAALDEIVEDAYTAEGLWDENIELIIQEQKETAEENASDPFFSTLAGQVPPNITPDWAEAVAEVRALMAEHGITQ